MPANCCRGREREGVTYLPGKYFAVSRPQPNGLRISFAGMTPEEIRLGTGDFGPNISELRTGACERDAPRVERSGVGLGKNERRTTCTWMKLFA